MSIAALAPVAHCSLWRVDLDATPSAEAAACLSDEEWARAQRFVFARDRRRFVAAHAALRSALAAHTGMPGGFLDFKAGPFGKPALVEPAEVRFNLSHSASVALIAIGADTEIGVDVELVRPMADAPALAEAHFTEAERHALAHVAPEERDRAFLRGWTRKEACLKAAGVGLGLDTRTFDVGLDAGEREVRIELDDGTMRLTLASFDGGPGVVCAVARVLSTEARTAMRTAPAAQENELFA